MGFSWVLRQSRAVLLSAPLGAWHSHGSRPPLVVSGPFQVGDRSHTADIQLEDSEVVRAESQVRDVGEVRRRAAEDSELAHAQGCRR